MNAIKMFNAVSSNIEFLEHIHEPVILLEPVSLLIVSANPAAQKLLGNTLEVAEKAYFRDITEPAVDTSRIDADKHVTIPVMLRNRQGVLIPVELHSAKIKIESTNYLQISIRDLRSSIHLNNRLFESENRINLLSRATSTWIWESDREGYISYSSAMSEMFTDLSSTEVLGQRLDKFFSCSYESVADYLHSLFEKDNNSRQLIDITLKKESTWMFQLNAMAVKNILGQTVGFRGVCIQEN